MDNNNPPAVPNTTAMQMTPEMRECCVAIIAALGPWVFKVGLRGTLACTAQVAGMIVALEGRDILSADMAARLLSLNLARGVGYVNTALEDDPRTKNDGE